MKRSAIALHLIAAALLNGCGFLGDPDQRVMFPPAPESQEHSYVDLAWQIASEKPCYLIAHDSVSVAPLNSPGTRAEYLRSRCFANVARRTARPELCDHVVSVSTVLYAGHENGRQQCRQTAERASASGGVGMMDHDAMLVLAGFSNEEIEALVTAHQLPDHGRYCLLFSPEFFKAIERMPRFSSLDDLERMKRVEWKAHPFLTLPGFPCQGKFMDTG